MSPSLSIWHRLEPYVGDTEMTTGLEAAVRDPAWMLARQWQVGEFRGSNGGSPVKAEISTQSVPLTSYRPGPSGGS